MIERQRVGTYLIEIHSRAHHTEDREIFDRVIVKHDNKILAEGDFLQTQNAVRSLVLDLAGVLSTLERLSRT